MLLLERLSARRAHAGRCQKTEHMPIYRRLGFEECERLYEVGNPPAQHSPFSETDEGLVTIGRSNFWRLEAERAAGVYFHPPCLDDIGSAQARYEPFHFPSRRVHPLQWAL